MALAFVAGSVAVALVAGTAAIATADEVVELGAKVTGVERKGNSLQATIDRGRLAGLRVGAAGQVYSMRTELGSNSSSVDFYVRLARARVVKVADSTATLELDAVAGEVGKGAYALFDVQVPDALAGSALFRIVSFGVVLRPQQSETPFLTVEAMRADQSPALRQRALDAMIKDFRGMRSIIVGALKGRIQQGKYHGKSAGEIIDGLDRAQLEDFFLFIEGFPGRYIGHQWKVPEIFFTWVIQGTPSGERERKLRAAGKVIAEAEAAAARGRLGEARQAYDRVLRDIPDHEDAKKAVEQIDRVLMLSRRVREDPDDTSARHRLMRLLAKLDAYEKALEHHKVLRKQGYSPQAIERFRAEVLVEKKDWKGAQKAFAALARERPKDAGLDSWLRYVKLRARLDRRPDDARTRLALGALLEEFGNWDSAVAAYRRVLETRRATPAQRKEAARRQALISLRKELESDLAHARSAIRKHSIAKARERIEEVVTLAGRLNESEKTAALLKELADLARTSMEGDLAIELYEKIVELTPGDSSAVANYVFALLLFDRDVEAEKILRDTRGMPGPRHSFDFYLARLARRRGDFAEAERAARRAAESPTYSWPHAELVRVFAHNGDWASADRHAERALELNNVWELRDLHAAVAQGAQASEALRASPDSARERLRLVRALADIGLPERVATEIGKLPAEGSWRSEAWWALASSPTTEISLERRLEAARKSSPGTEMRKRHLRTLEARARLRRQPTHGATRIELARLYLQDSDFDRAVATLGPLRASEPVAAEVGDLVHTARRAKALMTRLDAASEGLTEREAADTALPVVVESRAFFDAADITQARVYARGVEASALAKLGRYDEAATRLDEAARIAKAFGDEREAARAASNLGWVLSQTGTLAAEAKALEAQRRLCDSLDDEECAYGAYLQLATVVLNSGRPDEAIEASRRAWNLAKRMGDTARARNARFVMADGNLVANRLSEAERLGVDLLADSRAAEDVNNEQYALLVLGAVAAMRGQGDEARRRFGEVYELGTRTGKNDWRALARRLEGEAWLIADHEPKKAVPVLEHGAELYATFTQGWAAEQRGNTLRMLADAHLQAGDTTKARRAIADAFAVVEKFHREADIGRVFSLFAFIAAEEKKGDEALAHARRAVAETKGLSSPSLQWAAWYAMARAHTVRGERKEALEAFERSIELLGQALLAAGGESDRAGLLNTGRVRDVYKDAIDAMLAAGKSRRAVELLELSRDARLQQMFDPTTIETDDAQLRARLDKLQLKRARVQGLEKQLSDARAKPRGQRDEAQVRALGRQVAQSREELQQVVLDLKLTHRRLFQALTVDPQNLVARRKDLPPGSVVVEYFVAEDALYAFIISAGRSQPAVVKVEVASETLEKTVIAFRRAIIDEPENVAALGIQLDDWILEPVRPYLEGATSLIVMPFGPLYYVPFDALVTSAPGGPVRYAVEDLRISIQTETTLERLLEPARPRSSGTLLAVANPDGSLPSAQREVRRIVRGALPDARVLERRAATVDRFTTMAGGFRYLHLATHGVLDPDPRKTHLKLADGTLSVRQIAGLQGLDRNNELVVLSACDTAMERGESSGDELVSLAYAFARAGAPALVASLWEVSDASTAELMGLFYRALEQNGGDRLDALRNAKLNLLRATRGKKRPYASPWHWASFQLYGDYRAGRAAR